MVMHLNTKASMKRYHEFVATLPCSHCGIQGYSNASHYQGYRGLALGRGGSIKAHDLSVAPLCVPREGEKGCHARFDDYEIGGIPGETREVNKITRSELFLFWVMQTMIAGQAAGKIATI